MKKIALLSLPIMVTAILLGSFLIKKSTQNKIISEKIVISEANTTVYVDEERYFLMNESLDLSKAYEDFQINTLDIEPCLEGNVSDFDSSSEYYFFMNRKSTNQCLTITNKQGELISSISLEDLTDREGLHGVRFHVNKHKNIVYIGSTDKQIVRAYTFTGKLVEEKNIDFYFINFASSTDADRFLFFSPMNIYQGRKAFILTDDKFNILQEFFELPDIIADVNILTSNSFKYFGNKVYFNPPLTSDIYEITFEGEMKKVFAGKKVDSSILEKIKAIGIENTRTHAGASQLKRILPFTDFYVNDEFIVYKSFIEKKHYTTVVNKYSNKAITHQNAILLNNFGELFKFVFLTPNTVDGKSIISWKSARNYNVVTEHLQKEYGKQKFSYLPISKNAMTIFKYKYDFEYLFSNGVNNLPSKSESKDLTSNKQTLASINKLISVFPNPANNNLNLKFENITSLEDVSIKILNIEGKVFSEQKLDYFEDETQLDVDVSSLPNGIYYISIYSNDGKNHLGNTSFMKY